MVHTIAFQLIDALLVEAVSDLSSDFFVGLSLRNAPSHLLETVAVVVVAVAVVVMVEAVVVVVEAEVVVWW